MVSGNKKHKKVSVFEATCPACGTRIHLRKMPRRGQFITCQECDSMLVVARLAPLRLEWAFEEPFDNDRGSSDHYIQDLHSSDDGWYSQSDISDEADFEEFDDD